MPNSNNVAFKWPNHLNIEYRAKCCAFVAPNIWLKANHPALSNMKLDGWSYAHNIDSQQCCDKMFRPFDQGFRSKNEITVYTSKRRALRQSSHESPYGQLNPSHNKQYKLIVAKPARKFSHAISNHYHYSSPLKLFAVAVLRRRNSDTTKLFVAIDKTYKFKTRISLHTFLVNR